MAEWITGELYISENHDGTYLIFRLIDEDERYIEIDVIKDKDSYHRLQSRNYIIEKNVLFLRNAKIVSKEDLTAELL